MSRNIGSLAAGVKTYNLKSQFSSAKQYGTGTIACFPDRDGHGERHPGGGNGGTLRRRGEPAVACPGRRPGGGTLRPRGPQDRPYGTCAPTLRTCTRHSEPGGPNGAGVQQGRGQRPSSVSLRHRCHGVDLPSGQGTAPAAPRVSPTRDSGDGGRQGGNRGRPASPPVRSGSHLDAR